MAVVPPAVTQLQPLGSGKAVTDRRKMIDEARFYCNYILLLGVHSLFYHSLCYVKFVFPIIKSLILSLILLYTYPIDSILTLKLFLPFLSSPVAVQGLTVILGSLMLFAGVLAYKYYFFKVFPLPSFSI